MNLISKYIINVDEQERKIVERADEEKALYEYIDLVKIDEMHEFVIKALNEYGTEEKLMEANKVAYVTCELLKSKNLLSETVHQSFVDILIVAALLHNLFYDGTDWTNLYKTRKELTEIAKTCISHPPAIDTIFQTVEAQLGENTPVNTSKPQPNTPTELFATAVWIAKEYKPLV